MALAIEKHPSIIRLRDRVGKRQKCCSGDRFECPGIPRFSAQLIRQITRRILGRGGSEKWLVNSDVEHLETLHGGGRGFESPRLHSKPRGLSGILVPNQVVNGASSTRLLGSVGARLGSHFLD